MKRSICLVVLFLLAQFFSAFFITICVNIPHLLGKGKLDLNALVSSPTALAFSMILSAALMVGAMWIFKWLDIRSLCRIRLGAPVYTGSLLLMVPAIFIVNVMTEQLALEDMNETLFQQLMNNFWGVLAIVVIGPLSEEFVFRMGIQHHLMRRHYSPYLSILIASLIFGTIHGNPAQIPGAVLLGAVLGWLYWRSGSIWLSVIAHAFNNLIGVLFAWIPGGEELSWSGLCGGTWGLVIALILAVVLFVVCYKFIDRMFPVRKDYRPR